MSIVAVAKKAGVSHTTVSRVINRSSRVDSVTAARVEKAMAELGYSPPAPERRRGPRPGQNRAPRTVALLLLDVDPQALTRWPVWSDVLDGAMSALSKNGMMLALERLTSQESIPLAMKANQVGGLLLGGNENLQLNPRVASALRKLPAVWIMTREGEFWGDCVCPDNAYIGREAVQYLIQSGCRRLAFLNPQSGQPAFARRRDSFCGAVRNSGRSPEVFEAAVDRFEDPSGSLEEAIGKLLDRLLAKKNGPVGLFVPALHQAAEVYRGLHRRKITPGKHVRVITCNYEKQILETLSPRPATFDIHGRLMGATAVEMLKWRMDRDEHAGRLETLVKPELIRGVEGPS